MLKRILSWMRKSRPHRHRLVTGLGMYGDAVTCIECGWSKYPEVAPFIVAASEMLPETPENIRLANEAIARREQSNG